MKKLHPKLDAWLGDFNKTVAGLIAAGFKATPTNAREGLANLTRSLVTEIPTVAWVQDDLVATVGYAVPVRIYHPAPENACPVLIYLHGGGHMAGSVSVYDPICRKLAQATRHIIVSVDYRLAPECPYPAGLEDTIGVIKNIWNTLAQRQLKYLRVLSIAGDSGGGALVASAMARLQFDASVSIKNQIMIYPSLDYTMESASMQENGEGYLLQRGKIAWYFDQYFQHGEDRQAASPLFAEFTPRLPPTLMVTAEFCPLRDEGLRYIEKLRTLGIRVEHLHYDNMIHTFVNMENLVPEACQLLYTTIARFLNAN